MASLLRTIYDAGVIVGTLGMLLALGFLLWTTAHGTFNLLQFHNHESGTFSKRSLDGLSSDSVSGVSGYTGNSIIMPIIPGVTVPFSHIPAILFAVFYSQVVHEFGHAVAAAVENMPITSVGVSLTVVVPAAFVGFSNDLFDALPSRARSRITAAGPFHNLGLWFALILIGWSGIGDMFARIAGYKDMHHIGPVVVRVDEGSPLYHHLIPGTIITMLDDTNLGSQDPLTDIWTKYLTISKTQDVQQGWCVNEQAWVNVYVVLFINLTTLQIGQNPAALVEIRMKNQIMDFHKGACVDPVPILTQSTPRCKTNDSCSVGHVCMRPARNEQLLRLTFQRPDTEVQQSIVWSGPRKEVWEEVEVCRFASLSSISPIWLPNVFDTLWQYLRMATLSLFFLNLLPLPHMDGHKLLNSLLDVAFHSDVLEGEIYDVEALQSMDGHRNQRGRNHGEWKRRISIYVPWTTLCIVTLCTVVTLVKL
ncbi:peptidase family M50-domain-containing protein [Cyathus striatus]|nr:peptidase family M50-domain-containing protein [Cyathus striatus]